MDWLFEKIWMILVAIFGPILAWLWEAICEALLYFWNTLSTFFCLVFDWVVQAGESLVSSLLLSLPSDLMPVFSNASTYWGMANYYLPLSETMVVIEILFSFWAVFIVVKMALKLIPTVG